MYDHTIESFGGDLSLDVVYCTIGISTSLWCYNSLYLVRDVTISSTLEKTKPLAKKAFSKRPFLNKRKKNKQNKFVY